MQIRSEFRERFWVAGLEERTTNAAEANPATGKIAGLWQRVFADDVAGRTQNHLDEALVAVYHDYDGGRDGEYSLTVGSPVQSLEGQPADLAFVRLPAQRYAVITSERGQMPGVVIAAWQAIWDMTPQELGGSRAFEADFEVYDNRAADPADAQVEIWVGLEG